MTINARTSAGIALGLTLTAALLSSVMPRGDVGSASTASYAQGKPASSRIAGLGVVEPAAGLVDLAPLMPGVIAAIHVREGDRVKQNDLLVEFLNDDLKAKVAQAEALVTVKRADLTRIRRGPRPEEIRKAEAQLKEEESNLKLLELQHTRRQNLARAGAVSAEAYNTASSSLAASRERRQAVQQTLSILRQGSRPEEIEAAEGEMQLAEQQHAEARAVLARSYIRATVTGTILRRYKEPGEAVLSQNASPILQIADTSRLVVRTQVDEDEIAPLKIGQAAEITAPALGNRKLTGRVVRIAPRLGAKTISTSSPTEKRDARVLDVIVALQPGLEIPVDLRVDVVIDPTDRVAMNAASDEETIETSSLRP